MKNRPLLLYADEAGNILDCPHLEMVGASADLWRRLQPGDWIPLPLGSELFLLPARLPVGFNPETKRFEILSHDPVNPSQKVQAVAAFMAPAHTQTYSAAYKTLPGAPLLPLFAYTAVGWLNGRFVATGIRVDPDPRQDLRNFNPKTIERNARRRMNREKRNRLIQHLGKCAITYGCPAARNLFMDRWEAPLPTSPVCNARCLGCISFQEREDLCANQDRITFVPTPDEICGVAVPHLKDAPRAVVSFGQGCEGEPLLQAETLAQAVRMMRQETPRGTINLNTNGSLPQRVEKLCEAGLDSIRVSMNSSQPQYYQAYFNPRGYTFEDIKQSLKTVKDYGRFASINYFVLPGFTDSRPEFDSLCRFIEETRLDLIQMRNLNIDPEWYLRHLKIPRDEEPLGIRPLMKRLKDRFPELRLGYFNPCLNET
ncbi:radical SAM protein [Desulforhabdus amnigena]|jgi:pyruvate-formate lyase-activating enzyme|uniref:radical SAM protein n=1 Tax=Desulforhabdus amnigena TaxID=40218 RepID=UPI00249144C1|nr:radical SAM protein [Desulforhabdus amnigena]